MNRILTCRVGDHIISNANKMIVAEIITPGGESYMVKSRVPGGKRLQEGRRSEVSAYPVTGNGQIMTRSPRCIGSDWVHDHNLGIK